MKLVIIESPYAAATEDGILANVRYARSALHHALMRGEAPFASHLLYTQEGVLRDAIKTERRRGILAGHAWFSKADLICFYTDLGWTPGMLEGLRNALSDKKRISVRAIFGRPHMPSLHLDPLTEQILRDNFDDNLKGNENGKPEAESSAAG
jgi:hypothetical protein